MSSPAFRRIAERAARRYRRAGQVTFRFARGKLLGDPLYEHLLARGVPRQARRILDLGCGRGLVAALLDEARSAYDGAGWPRHWPAPPAAARVLGIDLMPRDIARARAALGAAADFAPGDIARTPFPPSDLVLLLDILHYLPFEAQERVLERAAAAVAPHGRLVLRIGDAAAGPGFLLGRLVDHLVAWGRGQRLRRLYCRPADAWIRMLGGLGFAVEARPMSEGTPFANVLLIADPAPARAT